MRASDGPRARGSRWAGSRRTGAPARLPFGALAPLLPPGDDTTAGRLPLLQQTRAALAELAAARPLVLAVDDAQFLDEPSAVLVHQLATTQSCFVMMTVRQGEPGPDPIRSLVQDDRVARVELDPFDEDACRQLLERALDGTVEPATVTALRDATGGNALFLRELVRGSIDAGSLQQDEHGWRLVAPLQASTQLHDLIAARLRGLPEHERLALELPSIAEPLGVELIASLGATPLGSLEEQGLVTITTNGRRTDLDCAHPVHADVIRDQLPMLRRRRLRGELAAAIEATGARRREDVLLVATLSLDSGRTPPPGLLLTVAHQAYFANDLPIAERLALAAIEADDTFEARHLLSEILYRQGRGSEALAADELDLDDLTDEQLALRALRRSATQFWQGGDRDGADRTLADAAGRLTGPGAATWRDEVIAQRATFDVNAGRPALALERLDGLTGAEGRAALEAALVSACWPSPTSAGPTTP